MGDFIRRLLRDTSSHHRPWQLSAAMALGVLCGLLPKFSLMFCLIGGLCCATPIHLPLAALTCLASSFASTEMVATAGRVGLWSLTHPDLMEMWLKLNAQPWVPWLGLNNSVVHGSLLLGLALLIPVYTLTKPISNRFAPQRRSLGAAAADADFEHQFRPLVARADPSARSTVPIETKVACYEPKSLAFEPDATWPDEEDAPDVDEQTCQALEDLLATCNSSDTHELSADEVVQRAAQMAHFVDDLLTSCQLESASPTSKPLRRDTPRDRPATHLHDNQSLSSGESGLVRHHADHSGNADHADSSRGPSVAASPSVQRPMGEVHQAETLRYLLHHLKAIKDRVSTDADQ